jgi:GAF domain-containing protein
MEHSDGLAQSIATLSRFYVGEATVQEVLDKVADLCRQTIDGADMVGITMVVDGKPKTAVFTDDSAPSIDSTQYETGVGPCLDAFRHQKVLRIDSVEDEERWRPFCEAAAEHGVKSTLSLPLVVSHDGVGAMNLYSCSPRAFSEEDEQTGVAFAGQAAIALANAQAYWDANELSRNLTEAMRSRATIEQAKGILMAARRCGPDEAFEVLVKASQRENRKLRDVADRLVRNTADSNKNGPRGSTIRP